MKGASKCACWVAGTVLVYVLSSGPALLLSETRAWTILFPIYLPLKTVAQYAPLRQVMYPYWRLFSPDHEPSIFEVFKW